MSMNYERRVSKLEKISPKKSLPVIRLVRDETEDMQDVFERSGYSGSMGNFLIIWRIKINPLPTKNDNDFMPSLHPAQAN